MASRLRPRSAGAVRRDISSTTQSWPEIPALPPAEAAGRTDWNGRFVLGHAKLSKASYVRDYAAAQLELGASEHHRKRHL